MVISAIDYPDFIVKLTTGTGVIVETKGLVDVGVDVDVPHKMQRLAQWVSDLNLLQSQVAHDFAFVDEPAGPPQSAHDHPPISSSNAAVTSG
ncbi:MAG: hypothetical protein RLZZ117_253 [Cyanobacteriota bacterium]|jgi:hypothetical protein